MTSQPPRTNPEGTIISWACMDGAHQSMQKNWAFSHPCKGKIKLTISGKPCECWCHKPKLTVKTPTRTTYVYI